MPPVCSKSVRRRSTSLTPKRSAMPGSPPDRLDRRLRHLHVARSAQDVVVGLQPAGGHGLHDLGHVHMRLGDRDGRTDVPAGGQLVGEHLGHQMAPRIERHDLLGIEPALERADRLGRRGVGEVGPMVGLELLGRDRQRPIDAVAAGMHADGVAPGRIGHGPHDGAAQLWIARTPDDRRGRLPPWEGWVFSLMCAMCFPDAKRRESDAF